MEPEELGLKPAQTQLLGRLDDKQLLPGETLFLLHLPLAAEEPCNELGAVPIGGLAGGVTEAR